MNAQKKIEPAKKDTGIINIHGKEYQSVALRVSKFRDVYPSHSLTTAVLARDPECVVMQATIADEQGRVLATGHSEEYRKASQINRTSALENAETSAIGRALAALGFGGTEFATANEVQNAIHQQNEPSTGEPKKEKPVPLDGPYKSKTALWAAVRQFDRTIRGIGDLDELIAFLETEEAVELIEQCKRDALGLWSEGLPDLPEFVPLEMLIKQTRDDLEKAEFNNVRTPIDAG